MPFSQGLIGAASNCVWKPPLGVTPGVAGDATAPFALGTVATGIAPRALEEFARVGATGIGVGATTGITAGVTVAAAAGNTFTNDTGVALVTGDYAWFSVAPVTTP